MKNSMDTLTLEQKVGQLFMVGFPGTRVTTEVRYLFRDLCFGGVILFKRNLNDVDQTRALIRELQDFALEATGLPLFVAIDEEGGPIVRLPKGSPIFPGPMALAATKSITNVRAIARATARELKSLGFNLDFAPIMDVASEPRNPAIGVRSFGEDPDLVSQYGSAYIQALQTQGIMATAKHFPGLGACAKDPHLTLPMVFQDRDHLERIDFPPFRAAVSSRVSWVMVSNACYPVLEREPGLPACLSRSIVSGLLRKELGFNGLIVTDDLTMGAVSRRFTIAEASLRSLKAGCDQVLICRQPRVQALARKSVLRAFQARELTEKRLGESLERILKAKSFLTPYASRRSEAEIPIHRDLMPHTSRLAQQVIERSVTLVKSALPLVPLPRNLGGSLGLILPAVSRVVPMAVEEEPSQTLVPFLSAHYKVHSIQIGITPSRDDIRKAKSLAQSSAAIIFGSYNALQSRIQAKLVRQLLRLNGNLIVVSLRNPYDLTTFPGVPCFIVAYSFRPPAMEALAKVLLGEIKPKGVLPVNIPGL
jgi:beta-N-acetylhexosaminidase